MSEQQETPKPKEEKTQPEPKQPSLPQIKRGSTSDSREPISNIENQKIEQGFEQNSESQKKLEYEVKGEQNLFTPNESNKISSGMDQGNQRIYDQLLKIYHWLVDVYNKFPEKIIEPKELPKTYQQIQEALDLIKRLLKDKEQLKSECQKYRNYFQALEKNVEQIQGRLKEKENLEKELDETRNKLLASQASLNQDKSSHYDGTSDRPQHHILTGEYKTLKEQYLDPLANSLFNLKSISNSESKQQRREKINHIKSIISATVLIKGQTIMRGGSTTTEELPPRVLEEMQNLLCQELQLNPNTLSQQTSELLKKAVNCAQGKVEYPKPGQWQEEEFNQASLELRNYLSEDLDLDLASITDDLQNEIQKVIQETLHFLQRANLADPQADLALDNKGSPFRIEYHEAAKGWNDEGIIVKTIYPLYLVNGEAKVKGVVLTEPSTSSSPNPSYATSTFNSPFSTEAKVTSHPTSASSTEYPQKKEDEKEMRIRLEEKRESLINSVKKKWFYQSMYNDSESSLLKKLSEIERIDQIEELEKEFDHELYFQGFEEKVNSLIKERE